MLLHGNTLGADVPTHRDEVHALTHWAIADRIGIRPLRLFHDAVAYSSLAASKAHEQVRGTPHRGVSEDARFRLRVRFSRASDTRF